MIYPSGDKASPINKEKRSETDIEQTTQIRLGIEYLVITANSVVPVRMGVFYDPEPAPGNVDDFYGASIGTGILFEDLSFDIAYQYRFGEKSSPKFMLEREISSEVKQHYLYGSIILYF